MAYDDRLAPESVYYGAINARIAEASCAKYGAAFRAAHPDVYDFLNSKKFKDKSFIANMADAMFEYGRLTDRQLEAVKTTMNKFAKANEAKANESSHYGVIKAREAFSLLICNTFQYESEYGTVYGAYMTNADGQTFYYKGSKFIGDKGHTINITATICEHIEKEGIKMTKINRPKM